MPTAPPSPGRQGVGDLTDRHRHSPRSVLPDKIGVFIKFTAAIVQRADASRPIPPINLTISSALERRQASVVVRQCPCLQLFSHPDHYEINFGSSFFSAWSP